MDAIFIYPNQLYKKVFNLDKSSMIFLIEDSLFFGDKRYKVKFHKQKLLLHKLSLTYYKKTLGKKGFEVQYIQYKSEGTTKEAFKKAKELKVEKIKIYYPYDFILTKRIKKYSEEFDINVNFLENPNFLNSINEYQDFFKDKKSFFFNKYYKKQRKRLDILVDKNGEPEGGDWSYDKDNRKKLPKNIKIPKIPDLSHEEIKKYEKFIEENFANNPGYMKDFVYPINHRQAENWLEDFLENKFEQFGPYEDAIDKDKTFLFHSVLSSSINLGLLSPDQVVNKSLKYAKENDIPINSLEGFVRQIIGWREYMKDIYHFHGVKIRNSNFFDHQNKLNDKWYSGKTNIKPIDDAIIKLQKNAYTHHIERLMVLGNIMFMCKVNPKEVYKWFMEMYIDAYDWVMVPNVYSMSQFADGGMIVTKPYFSSSNYILKMSNYSKTEEWTDEVDALFWNFMDDNQKFLKKNARMGFLLQNLEKKNMKSIKKTAKKVIKRLTK